jgi:NodT family efflux transporter outer membrane factor (OMF) lipoprotein
VRRFSGFVLVPAALLGGCALQPAYQRPALDLPGGWSNASADAPPPGAVEREGWWELLGDPAVDQLVTAGLRDNPTLAEAAARVDQARASAAVGNARRKPSLGATANLSRGQDRAGSGTAVVGQTSANIGANLAWELDLWGRLRETATAARHRLTARTADAEAARLSIVAEIADTTLALRACNLVHGIRERDIGSREVELKIIEARLAFGYVAPAAVATARSNLASARTERIAQEESCRRLVDALVALSGLDAATISQLLPRATAQHDGNMPAPPPFAPALPATVLLRHPGVVAAEREVAARWSEIAVARAEWLPRIDLTALLTGQWLRALGSSDSWANGSIGAGLTTPLFDGGAGAANVRLAEASYREAAAQLVFAVRTAVRDVEDALAAQQSAAARIETSREALAAAQFTLSASEARWRAGSIAQLELEEARRQSNRAQESAVVAAADRARAWVALVRRTGTPWQTPPIEPGDTLGSGNGNGRR